MKSTGKVRVTQDYEKLSDELKEQLKLVYPKGYSRHLIEFSTKDGKKVSALRFETDEKVYLIRMSVKEAIKIVKADDDYDDDGFLKDEVKIDYEDKFADVEYLDENDNYEAPDDLDVDEDL